MAARNIKSDSSSISTAVSRTARPAFGSSQTPSTFIFVHAGTTPSQEQKRQIRAQVMFASHEARRRQGLRLKGNKNPEEEYLPKAESPLQDASVMHPDPFDCLPVKAFPGMHRLIAYHFETLPAIPPLTDDVLGRTMSEQQNTIARRNNTVWGIMSSEKTSLLVLLVEMARFLDAASPCAKWRILHFSLKEKALQSIMEGLSSPKLSDAYLVSIAGVQAGAALFGDEKAARYHLSGLRELVRRRGGTDTFAHLLPHRIIVWCELYGCAAHQLLPTITPARSALDDSNTPIPPAFLALVAAAHARTLARLPPIEHRHRHHSGAHTTTGFSAPAPPPPLHRIIFALHLVSTATSPPWSAVLMGPGPTRDAVASVLDDAAHSALVELALIGDISNDKSVVVGEVGENRVEEEEEGEEEEDGDEEGDDGEDDRRLRVVLLHAAHVYLWTALSHLPPGAQLNVLFLERLQRALLNLEGSGKSLVKGETTKGRREGESRDRAGGLAGRGGAAEADGLAWALAVGWYLADRVCMTVRSGKSYDGVRTATRGGVLLGWFEDRIADLLTAFGGEEAGVERAARVVADFPGTEEFRRGWHRLLLLERFRGRPRSLEAA